MQFNDMLNEYMAAVGCTAKELARASGLSPAAISRYRSGARTPARDSEQVHRLATGIAVLAGQSGIDSFDERAAFNSLNQLSQQRSASGGFFSENLNKLIASLGINVNQLSKFVNYDASYISRIRSGQRSPSNTERFATAVATYVARVCTEPAQRQDIARLLQTPGLADAQDGELVLAIQEWLCSSREYQPPVEQLLRVIDDFDITKRSEGLTGAAFPDSQDEHHALRGAHRFWGIDGLVAAELEFMEATLAWPSPETITIYSDMPLDAVFANDEFTQRWSAWLFALMQRGDTVQIIHDVDRPMQEMLMGVRSWLPMYLAGQVRSLYLRPPRDSVFNHFMCVADACALTGEGIAGHVDQSCFTVCFEQDDIIMFQARAQSICKTALPLMELFQAGSRDAFKEFMHECVNDSGERRTLRTTLPLHTLSLDLLNKIMERTGASEVNWRRLRRHLKRCQELVEELLSRDVVVEQIPVLTEQEFADSPVRLGLSSFFFGDDIICTYEEYCEHLELTRAYAREHADYRLVESLQQQFNNLQIVVCRDQWAVVSKCSSPETHFLIRHPRLVQALEAYVSH